jgi:hypothetical protein
VSPALISSDGRWWWDGARWRSRLVEGELDLFWFTSTPDWFGRVALTGLIGLIPIIGTINLFGWTLVATDMVRQRWRELPPAGFHYLDRGAAPFVVALLYGMVALFILFGLLIGGILLLIFRPVHVAIGVGVVVIAIALLVPWWLISLYFFGSVLIASDTLGIGRPLDPRRLVAVARQNPDASLHVALVYGGGSIALAVLSSMASFVIPFGGVIAALVTPAILAMVVPWLATFRVDGYTQT